MTDDFTYGSGSSGHVRIAIVAAPGSLQELWAEEAGLAGATLTTAGDFAALAETGRAPSADVIIAEVGEANGATLAALALLDEEAAHGRRKLIVATPLAALEAVFASLPLAQPTLLVAPTHGERVLALGHALADRPLARVRELSADERTALLRLAEQVGQIAARLEGIAPTLTPPVAASAPANDQQAAPASHAPRPPLPDPRLVRRIIHQRQQRARFFDGGLFADPAWDILLDLTAARAEHVRVSVTSLCIASGVPPTTALRWIAQMVETGLLERQEDTGDRRRAFIALSDRGADAMARYFAAIGAGSDSRVAALA